MRKKILTALLALCALTALCVGTACAAGTTATPTNDSLVCDGVLQAPTVYKINGSNYFKIRDLAAILNGTGKQFAVGYDVEKQSVTADTGAGYIKLSSDLTGAPGGGNKSASPSNDAIYINGVRCQAEVYKIDGMNYFKLRDLGQALDFYVGWDSRTNTVALDTTKGYGEDNSPTPNPLQNISDQELLKLAQEILWQTNSLPTQIIRADFLQYDGSDTITVDNSDFPAKRVIGYTTIAQVEAIANDLWYQSYSRRGSRIDEGILEEMRRAFVERNGKLYHWEPQIGSGEPLDVDRMVSRTTDEAVFDAYSDWGDGSDISSFQFSLVFEDGTWKYLAH